MKVTFLTLCVLLPAICLSTPLPTNEASASSDAKATSNGGTAAANSNASAVAGGNAPTTTPTTAPPTAKADSQSQAQASGGNSQASSSSSAQASSGSCAPTGKATVEGFTDYEVVVYTEGDFQKFAGVEWYTWKTTQITSETIQTQSPVCTPRYYGPKCKGVAFKFVATSETECEYIVFGTDETTIVEVKQSISIVSEGFQIFQTKVVDVNQVTISSEEVTVVQEKDTIATYLDKSQFAVLATDFTSYIVTVTNGEQKVVSVSVSLDVYQDEAKKQEIWTSISQVFSTYNIQESQFVEVTATVEYQSYNWDQPAQGNSNGGSSASASSQATAETEGNGDAKASSSSQAQANGQSGGKGPGNNSGSGSGSGSGSSSGSGSFSECGNGDVAGFEKYSVLVKNDKFFESINEKVFYLWKITEVQEQITVDDVGVCVDRYACKCQAVKFQYVKEKETIVLKEWGYDGSKLLYVQENISVVSEKYLILQADVQNVMKATADTDVAVSVDSGDQITTYLSTSYAILGTDGSTFVVGQTSDQSGSVTFVALVEEYYKSPEKQQEVSQLIVEILQKNSIDESTLTIVISGEFTVDTNKYNKVTQTSEVQSKDGKTTTKQATTTEGENCGAQSETQTSVTNNSPPKSSAQPTIPTPSASPSTANASSNSQATSTGNGSAQASGQSSANANNGKAQAETLSTADTTGNGQASSSGKAEASS